MWLSPLGPKEAAGLILLGKEQGPEPAGVGIGCADLGLALPWGCYELWVLTGTSEDTEASPHSLF